MPHIPLDTSITTSPFAQTKASNSLRICCYGSSSSATPALYTTASAHVGYLLGKRGHVCVNGAGSCGCMAALNDGAAQANGTIVGVIHEMWLTDKGNGASSTENSAGTIRDGGAHTVFDNRTLLVASGPDLQERKRLLLDDADGVIVLPGGPGTWDELWEVACGRNIGLNSIPICVVNVDHYYDPFIAMLERAQKDQLIYRAPSELMHFCETAVEAVQWIEAQQEHLVDGPTQRQTSPASRWKKFCKNHHAVLSNVALVSVGTALGWWLGTARSTARH